MEPASKYSYLLADFKSALEGLRVALQIKLDSYDAVLRDVIQNGQVQKFETCAELTWKTMRMYLAKSGVDTPSASNIVYKEFYRLGHLSELQYEALLDLTEIRNQFSHVYSKKAFQELLLRLPEKTLVMEETLGLLENLSAR